MNKNRFRSVSPHSEMLHRVARGRNYKRPQLKLINFSEDEDELILKLHALLGDRWSLIAGRLPGRTDKEVMIHWETYLKRKLMKMRIDPTNHRLFHHTHYMTRRYLNSALKEHETNVSYDQSSSSKSESLDMTILPISSKNCSESSTSLLPDLNIGLIPVKTVTSLPACCLQDDSSESSNYGSTSTSQETLLLFW